MLSKEQLAVLATELAKQQYANLLADQEYEAIAALLNDRPMVNNPVAQPERPKFLSWDTFMGLLAAADVPKMYSYHWVSDLRQALEQNNRTVTLAIWRGLKTVITAASVTAVEAEAVKKEPDPTWSAQVPGDSIATALGLPRVDPRDVQAVAA